MIYPKRDVAGATPETLATIGHTSPLVGGRSNGEIDKLTTI